jgi:hypothetical protein
MALIDDLRDDRANAISTYYSSYPEYLSRLAEDGNNTYVSGEDGQVQARYKAFDDLIRLHHDLLQEADGYVTGAELDPEEGTVGTGVWWNACEASNSRAEFYMTDNDYAESKNSLFILNGKDNPYKRHPFLLWNQQHAMIGSHDSKGWKNAPSRATYDNVRNPLRTGSNYRLGEPLEWWGNTNNLLWNKIILNGYLHYRHDRLKDYDYDTDAYTGFIDIFEPSGGRPIGDRTTGYYGTNWASPFGVFRYSYWGTGSNTTLSDQTINSTGSNYFIQDGDTSASWNVNDWYLLWTSSSNWRIFLVTDVEVVEYSPGGGGTYYETTVSYRSLLGNSLSSSTTYNVIRDPKVPESNKQSMQSNVYDYIWSHIYDTHYSAFSSAIDDITAGVENLITKIDSIINYDYTAVNEEAGEEIGKPEAETLKSDLESWLTDWKTLVNDTGSGASFSRRTALWSNSNLDSIKSGTGGITDLISFDTDYDGDRSGILGVWLDSTVIDILGNYSLGSEEEWRPDNTTYSKNNSGNLGTGQQLYLYRHDLASKRVGRSEDGVLFAAWGAYKTWNNKLDEISQLESRMSNIVSENKYDLTPVNVIASTDEEDKIVLEWDAVKAASSYDIEYKEGISGSWIRHTSNYGYVDPGNPPNFEDTPGSKIEIQAHTRGYQEFGLNFTSSDDPTNLNDDFTTYDFYLSIDSGSNKHIKIQGLDCKTWEALQVTIQNLFEEDEIKATCSLESDDIRITSEKKGNGSSISMTAGTINDLFSALSTTPETPVDGTQQLEQGKVYYFRVRTNNGYDVSLGSDGNENDRDWNSKSEWDTSNYINDKGTNGVAGYIIWDEPSELTVSGFPEDNDLTPSSDHIYLEWNGVPNVDYYKIYRATSLDGGYAFIDSTSNIYFEDDTAIPGVVYYYKVQAVSADEYKLYDDSGNFTERLTGDRTGTGVRGKRLWVELTAEASKGDTNKITISWNDLSGANGYILYRSNQENGTFSYVAEDDNSEKIITDTSYIDKSPGEQFLEKRFDSPSEGYTSFDSNTRYYFIVVTSDTVKQYYITSPNSGTWTIQNIADQIDDAISEVHDNVKCKLVEFNNPSHYYKLKFETVELGSKASVSITGGTFGKSLLEILGDLEGSQDGSEPLPEVPSWYQVQGVEIVDGTIVRRSEMSNKTRGKRPVL